METTYRYYFTMAWNWHDYQHNRININHSSTRLCIYSVYMEVEWGVMKFVTCLRILLFLSNTSIVHFCGWRCWWESQNSSFFVYVTNEWHLKSQHAMRCSKLELETLRVTHFELAQNFRKTNFSYSLYQWVRNVSFLENLYYILKLMIYWIINWICPGLTKWHQWDVSWSRSGVSIFNLKHFSAH